MMIEVRQSALPVAIDDDTFPRQPEFQPQVVTDLLQGARLARGEGHPVVVVRQRRAADGGGQPALTGFVAKYPGDLDLVAVSKLQLLAGVSDLDQDGGPGVSP